MQDYGVSEKAMKAKASSMLSSGEVTRVIGWRKGLFDSDVSPSVFRSASDVEAEFVYNEWCAANLSKYLIKESRKVNAEGSIGKILIFLKPCDTYSFTQLIKEHRIIRENVVAVGVPCDGKKDPEKKELCDKCTVCNKKFINCDELLFGDETYCHGNDENVNPDRFEGVKKLEAMTEDERAAFWSNEFSRCIRCNACRNVCPACSCELCVFDNPNSGVSQKEAVTSFEEDNFHIIRAFHVAGRCTDCGECSRVCPQNIPLHLLNRKFISDIDKLYGDYEAGSDLESVSPLTFYTKGDSEPSVAKTLSRGAN